MRDDFGIFIMSYGRPENIPSLNCILKSNYTGKWWVVVGNDDLKAEAYQAKYKDRCVVFDKSKYVATADRMGLKITKVIMFARNACFDIAEQLGLKYFQQLDDDYRVFKFAFNDRMQYITKQITIKNYDQFISNVLKFFESTPSNCIAVAFAQGGDFIGGQGIQNWSFGKLRKTMNSWVCSTDRRFSFRGVMNEDVNAYTLMQSQGKLCLNLMQLRLDQPVTQTTGGMAEVYKKYGTHVKSFFSVMLNPSFCRIGMIRNHHQRLHHLINWNRCASKIVRKKYKKV